jgi:uncharacterized protein (TIRG00374 family)
MREDIATHLRRCGIEKSLPRRALGHGTNEAPSRGGKHSAVKKLISLLLPLVGVAIFVWIVRGIGLQALLDTFREVEPARLLIFLAFAAFVTWIRGVRWRHLIRMIGIEYSLPRAMLIWSVGFAAAAITPGKVGDAMRAYYLSRDTDRNLGECFLTVFIDRLLDLAAVLLAGIAALFIFSYYYIDLPNLWLIVGGVVGMFAFVYLLLHGKLLKKIVKPFFNLVAPDKYKAELSAHFNSFYQSLSTYVRDWRNTGVAILYTIIFWASVVVMAYTVTQVLGINVQFRYVLLMMPMITIVEILPISIAGIGTRDAAAIYFFGVVGVESAQAVGFSLLYVLVGTYLVAAFGFVAWLFKPSKFHGGVSE